MKYVIISCLLLISIHTYGQRVIKNGNTYSLADFSDTTFNSEADFSYAEFNSLADFSDTTFDSLANFYKAEFDSWAYFSDAEFNSVADFSDAEFNSEAHFSDVEFDSVADFSGAEFDSEAYFSDAEFNSTAYFSDVEFKDEVIFDFSTLPDTLYFSDVKTEKIIDFSNAENKVDTSGSNESENVCVIFLARTDLSKIRLNYTDFKLAFDEDSISKKGIANTYENLLLTQKEFPEGYKKLDIEYKEYKYLQQGLKGRIYNFFDNQWWNYGYNKEKVISNTFMILFIFSLINWFLFEYLNKKVYKIESVWNKYSEKINDLNSKGNNSRFTRKIIILPYSIYYTSLVFFGFRMSIDKINYNNHLGVFYISLVYLIGLVDLLFIANFVFTG